MFSMSEMCETRIGQAQQLEQHKNQNSNRGRLRLMRGILLLALGAGMLLAIDGIALKGLTAQTSGKKLNISGNNFQTELSSY
jgi:hypothetical protein